MDKTRIQVSEITESLHPYMKRVERLIVDALRTDIPLLDATNMSIRERPGKMLRPTLALLSAGAVSGITEDTLRFAAATELLHNATLLHDDVVDGATQRRGAPTVASLLDGRAAVLVGDFWLVKCMQVVLQADNHSDRTIRIFAKTLSDLAEGELFQMEKASKGDTTEEDYLRIIYCKTASLFETAVVSAAISVNAPEDVLEALRGFAVNLGLAFQIKDDIFDYESSSGDLGKPVGIDLLEQKITLPLLCALDSVSPEEASTVRRKVASISVNPALATEVRAFVFAHDGVNKAAAKLNFYIEKSISCLEILSDSPEKLYLASLARYVGDRNV